MATRKHNEFLDSGASDDEGSVGYNSDEEVTQKGGRNPKRRKVDSDADSGSESENEIDQVKSDAKGKDADDAEPTALKSADDKPKSTRLRKGSDISKPLTKKNLVATEKAIKRSGVVYLSRIPPFMKPQKLRSLLEPYGAMNRIFLSPEDPASHTRRVRNGGNKRRSFTDGWVEFVNKKDAKRACEMLNAQIIGGKKGSYYHDDVWNLLYLKGFKWNNLTEQIAAENAERAGRMRAEISKTTKENKHFVQNAARAKIWETREGKQAAKRQKQEENGEVVEEKPAKERRSFKQTAVAKKTAPADQPEQVKRILSKIF